MTFSEKRKELLDRFDDQVAKVRTIVADPQWMNPEYKAYKAIHRGSHLTIEQRGEFVMSVVTNTERARLRDLAGKATPGPWIGNKNGEAVWNVVKDVFICSTTYPGQDTALRHIANAHFMGASNPEIVVRLCDTVDRLAALLKDGLEMWSFNGDQQHTHTWHTRTDWAENVLPVLAELEGRS